jgi:alkanesulfonate monooxygenase SsuD/methylene tetrahydromethanopterin reductase-like flavin-dependent oxidoreductase (luciferase family)
MKVGVLFPSRFEDPGNFLADARAMEAAGADSVWMEESDGLDPMLVLAAIAAVTSRLRLGLIAPDNRSPSGVGSGRGLETLQHLSRQRVITENRRWRRVEVPADREAWAKTLALAHPDLDGVLVPMDPRLLDILRHPDEPIDRSDLLLAQG